MTTTAGFLQTLQSGLSFRSLSSGGSSKRSLLGTSSSTQVVMTKLRATLVDKLDSLGVTTTQQQQQDSSSFVCKQPTTTTTMIHLIILVHGIMGNPQELGYLQTTLEQQARQAWFDPTNIILVHSITANHGSTLDGIDKGGDRVADEINQVLEMIQEYLQQQSSSSSSSITLSIIGHSLGGLYARYALKSVNFTTQQVKPAIFCTTATPHLGVSQHTYIPNLPRFVEVMAAQTMGQSGRDLFRMTPIIDQLALNHASFTQPLSQFQWRLAYANAYATDFQVPTSTAAFLSATSESMHVRLNKEKVQKKEDANEVVNGDQQQQPCSTTTDLLASKVVKPQYPSILEASFVPLVVETQKRPSSSSEPEEETSSYRPADLTKMATALDDLGWIKVFCDVRDEITGIPKPPLPILSSLPLLGWLSPSPSAATGCNNNNKQKDDDEPPKVYSSRQLLQSMTGNSQDSRDWWNLPTGHTILVANSKTEWYGEWNAAGRQYMNVLAADVLQRLLLLNNQE